MAKPRTPNQKKAYGSLKSRLVQYSSLVDAIFDQLNKKAAQTLFVTTDYSASSGKPFSWSDYPLAKERVRQIQTSYVDSMTGLIYAGTSNEWKESNTIQDLLANSAFKAYHIDPDTKKYEHYYQDNSDALKAFNERREKGMNLSQRLWNQSEEYKNELECAISLGIQRGTNAVALSTQLRQYLNDFPRLQREYKLKYSREPEVRNARYAAKRLAVTEINMAYRTAENKRWEQMDFVVGIEIKTSDEHFNRMPKGDVCDTLQGRYPKDFQWRGWHPNCYSDDTEVLTSSGWKLFRDVLDDDLILSLNPETRSPEWTEITARQCFPFRGMMQHFSSNNLDCLVTPDHRMVYLNKCDGRIKYRPASDFTKGNGGFYRSCLYNAPDVESITIDSKEYPFNLFCEFMGYWLSDGSIQGNAGIVISQQDDQPARAQIIDCIREMGYNPTLSKSTLIFYNTPLRNYLYQFGTSTYKHIPRCIKDASPRQINIFLDAFICCDGYKRPFKSFIGSHGNEFTSKRDEREYFTTSKRMAGDLSELILKSGHHPSLSITEAKTSKKKDGSLIASHNDCYIVRECHSLSATVFNKEQVPYDGNVYDLTLAKNHIMYVQRKGKCFWGSNCLCYQIPILKTEDEFWADMDKEEPTTESENEVTEIPDNFEQWIEDNRERIETASERGTLPYFIQDNQEIVTDILATSEEPEEHRPTVQITDNISPEINTIHEETEEEKQILQEANDILSLSEEYFDIDTSTLQRLIATKDYSSIQQEAERLRNLCEDEKAKEARWLKLIPDAHKLHKQYSSAQLEEAYKYLDNVENSARNLLDKKIEYEKLYDDCDKNSTITAPPELLKSACLDNIENINNEAERTFISEDIKYINNWSIDHMQFTELSDMIYDLQKEIVNNGDIEHIKALYQDLIKEFDKDIALSDMQTRRSEAVYDTSGGSEADAILRGGAGRNWFNASQDERDAVFDYSHHYADINDALRNDQISSKNLYKKATNITSYISQETLPLDMWFQRGDDDMDAIFSRLEYNGTPLDYSTKDGIEISLRRQDESECNSRLQSLVGKTMWEAGFLSTGSGKGQGFDTKQIQLNIFAPRGTMAAYIEPFSSFGDGAQQNWDGLSGQNNFSREDETLFQRGTKLKIIKATYDQYQDKVFIDCEVIDQEVKDIGPRK